MVQKKRIYTWYNCTLTPNLLSHFTEIINITYIYYFLLWTKATETCSVQIFKFNKIIRKIRNIAEKKISRIKNKWIKLYLFSEKDTIKMSH